MVLPTHRVADVLKKANIGGQRKGIVADRISDTRLIFMVDEPCYVLNLHISEVLLMEWIDQMKMAMETLIDACNKIGIGMIVVSVHLMITVRCWRGMEWVRQMNGKSKIDVLLGFKRGWFTQRGEIPSTL